MDIGQKIKLVIAACLWNNPQVRFFTSASTVWNKESDFCIQICVLDEPSNFLDREALGGLAVAIRDWAGAVVRLLFVTLQIPLHLPLHDRHPQVIISHNEEFVTALCKSPIRPLISHSIPCSPRL